MEFFSIASGSSGNCLCVGDSKSHILIDAGISGKKIEEGLNTYGLTSSDMSGILVTHEHSDHIAGLGVLARRYGLPIYLTRGTRDAIVNRHLIGDVDESLFHLIEPDSSFEIDDFNIEALRVSHDAAEPVAYTFTQEGFSRDKRLAVLTDLGCFNDYTLSHLHDLDVILLESNHDIRMLQVGSYPYPLKQRILSEDGHLSNESAGELLCKVLHSGIRKIYLGHLSSENNYPSLAEEAVRATVTLDDCAFSGSDLPIEVAQRHQVSSKYDF